MIRRGMLVLLACALLAACSDDTTSTTSTTDRTTTTQRAATTTTAAPLDRYAGYQSVEYDDDAHWLCRPGRQDVCAGDIATSTVTAMEASADPTITVDGEPPFDCFYVYPTISRDPGAVSDWDAAEDQEGWVALNQVAPLRDTCRVFAPIYRQRTLASLASRVSGGSLAPGENEPDPYVDVLDAFKTYMAEDNDGRGVVLIGHSQGAGLLTRLIHEEIDGNEDVRSLLVSAYLAGSAIAEDEFTNVSLCTKDEQAGCVVTWASFRSTAPPPASSFFGKVRDTGQPAACNNPAALEGGPAEASGVYPTNNSGSILAALAPDAPDASPWIDPSVATVTTPFVRPIPGMVTVECVTEDGFGYLEVTVHGDPSDPRADDIGGDLTPEWGLHLIDVNLVMGDIGADIADQWAAWQAGR